MQIPITKLLVRLRREATHTLPGTTVGGAGEARSGLESLAWSAWSWAVGNPAVYRLSAWFATRFWGLLPGGAPVLKAWTRTRTKPQAAPRSLQELARKKGVPHV